MRSEKSFWWWNRRSRNSTYAKTLNHNGKGENRKRRNRTLSTQRLRLATTKPSRRLTLDRLRRKTGTDRLVHLSVVRTLKDLDIGLQQEDHWRAPELHQSNTFNSTKCLQPTATFLFPNKQVRWPSVLASDAFQPLW